MASAGHTCAQVGSSQCMHTIGAVWVVAARSMRSRWMSDWPRCVPHSMQRLHAGLAADAAALVDHEHRLVVDAELPAHGCSLVQFQVAGVGGVGAAAGALDAHGGDLELGHLRDRVEGPVGELVGGLGAGPVVGDEDGVGPDRVDHVRRQVIVAAPRRDGDEVAVGDAEPLGELRVHLAQRLGVLGDERRRCAGSGCPTGTG